MHVLLEALCFESVKFLVDPSVVGCQLRWPNWTYLFDTVVLFGCTTYRFSDVSVVWYESEQFVYSFYRLRPCTRNF